MNITEKELEAIVQAGKEEAQPQVRMNIVNIIGDICILLSKVSLMVLGILIFKFE